MRIVVLLFLAAACSKPVPRLAVQPDPLEAAVRGLPADPKCERQIPMEWSASLPVPESGAQRGLYRVFFSGRGGGPRSGFQAMTPGGSATFSPDGRASTCRRDPAAPAVIPGSSLLLTGMTLEEIVARSHELSAATRDVSRLYWSTRAPTEAQTARVAEFSRLFRLLANPAYAAAYRDLNPEFWSWVKKNGGA